MGRPGGKTQVTIKESSQGRCRPRGLLRAQQEGDRGGMCLFPTAIAIAAPPRADEDWWGPEVSGLKGPRDPSSEEQLSTSVSAIDRQEGVFPWILS